MRGKVLAASLAVLFVGSSIGCKSGPSMAWWKSSSKTAEESEVLAHSAPELPSEIAKQVEEVAAATTPAESGGEAAPFVPSVSTPAVANVATAAPAAPAPYPSTEAPKFTPTTATAAATPADPSSANLGSVAMPYNPNAVPPAAAATPAAAPATVDRYANVAVPSNNVAPAASYPNSVAPRYGEQVASAPASAQSAETQVAATTTSTTSTEATAPAPTAVTASLGDRYAQAAMPAAEVPVDNSLASPVTPTPTTVAESSPYRPGGTSTYPAVGDTQTAVQVATRPATAVESTQPTGTTAESTSLPATPTVPRYR